MKTRFFSFTFAAFILLVLAGSGHAQVVTPDPSLPVLFPPGVYTNLTGPHPLYPIPGVVIALNNEQHRPLGPVNRVPSGPDEMEQFNSDMFGDLSLNGGPSQPVSASGLVDTIVHNKIGNTTGTFQTEMLSMSLTGNSPLGPFMIRESPTLPSLGQTTVTDIGGGLYHIDSFFDVFTELSIDGGATWMPDANGPARMTLVPEPSVCVLAGLAAGLLLLRRGRWFSKQH